MLDANAILSYCQAGGFRISAKAFLVLEQWSCETDASGAEIVALLERISERIQGSSVAGRGRVFREKDMRELLVEWTAPPSAAGLRGRKPLPILTPQLVETSMETGTETMMAAAAWSPKEYVDEIERLKQIIQIILNKHKR